jgi:hypothetical protein
VRDAYRKLCEDSIKTLKRDVAKWEHKPSFRYKVACGMKLWYIAISHDSGSEAGTIYTYVDEGTGKNAGHGGKYPIVPRNAKALTFAVPTPTKTTPGVAGIPGIVMAHGVMQRELISVKKVMHPGIRPRNFSKSLRKVLNDRNRPGSFKSVTDAAVKRGLRKIGVPR